MTESVQPAPAGFWLRLGAANLASTIGFVPFYLLLIWMSFGSQLGPNALDLAYWAMAPRMILVIQIIILLGVLLFGYPIERWVQRAGSSRFRLIAPYLMVSLLLLLAGIGMAFGRMFGWTPIYFIYGAPVMAITSGIGRAIYEWVLAQKRAVLIANAVIAAICVIGAIGISTVKF